MQKMNLTIDARMINASGIGTVIRNVLKRIIYLKPEWQFNILGDGKELSCFDFFKVNNVRIIDCKAPIYSIKEQFKLIQCIPKTTDVFWSPHYNIPIFYNGKLIVTVHDVFHLAMPQFVQGIHKKIYAKFMFNRVKKQAEQIITVSQFTADELYRIVGVPKEKINVIYNGIDEDWFNIKLDKPVHNKPYILYVGNVKPHKNLIILIKAFSEVKDKIEQDLIIVGKKDGFITGDNKLSEFVNSNEDRIIFTGYVEDNVLKRYYKQADIFVFPSLYEGFGLPPLEALAAGCRRVICSNAAAIPEVCGDLVEYFDPFDKNRLKKLLINSKVNRDTVLLKNYDWNITVVNIINLIKKIINEH